MRVFIFFRFLFHFFNVKSGCFVGFFKSWRRSSIFGYLCVEIAYLRSWLKLVVNLAAREERMSIVVTNFVSKRSHPCKMVIFVFPVLINWPNILVVAGNWLHALSCPTSLKLVLLFLFSPLLHLLISLADKVRVRIWIEKRQVCVWTRPIKIIIIVRIGHFTLFDRIEKFEARGGWVLYIWLILGHNTFNVQFL